MRCFPTLLACLGVTVASLALPEASKPPGVGAEPFRPDRFVVVTDYVPSIDVDLHYASDHNFVGARIDGYETNRPLLTRAAAVALQQVQAALHPEGLGLRLKDAYRPQRAVVHFIRWAQDDADTRTRADHYPRVPKRELFAQGYLALESSHARGSAVDVTLVRRHDDGRWEELDLGTPVDFFGPEAHFDFAGLTPRQRQNRQRLRDVMEAHGFVPYDREWWHFTLRDEPYPETYFDFPVR